MYLLLEKLRMMFERVARVGSLCARPFLSQFY